MLGSGEESTILRGTDDTSNSVAIKVVRRPKTTAGSAYKSLVREVEAMRVLDHPHVLRLDHAIDTTTHDFCFLVTAQSDRDLLQEIEERGALDEPVAHKYWEGLMHAVTACHAAGIAHRESVHRCSWLLGLIRVWVQYQT